MRSIFTRIAVAAALLVAATAGTVNAASAQAYFWNIHDPNTTATLLYLLEHRTGTNPNFASLAKEPVIVVGHRGLVDAKHQENSIESITNLIDNNVEGMELDISIASDGVPYLMHDKQLTRMVGINNYSDIYEYAAAGYPSGLAPLSSSQLLNTGLCVNGANGYGKVFDHNTCGYDGTKVTTLTNALYDAYALNYQGLIWLDVRSHNTITHTAAFLINDILQGKIDAQWADWIRGHVILKFQSQLFNGPDDFGNGVAALTGLTEQNAVGYFYATLAVHSNVAAANEGTTGDHAWAVHDYENWRNRYGALGQASRLVGQEVSVKAVGSVLNYGQDNLFNQVWEAGKATGIYMPTPQCTYPAGAGTPTGTAGVYVNGGVCKSAVSTMGANECGSAGGAWNIQGAGCTDHRIWAQFTEQSMHYGFIITDQPIVIIDWINKNGGGFH